MFSRERLSRVSLEDHPNSSREREKSIIYPPFIHLHAYQPPRKLIVEGKVIFDISGEDIYQGGFNQKIWNESYQPVLNAGILDTPFIGFNFFGSLRDWIKDKHPSSWFKIRNIAKDRKNAVLADPYLHPILPLLPDRDKRLLVKIGIEAFKQDYGFAPLGFWLPEMAVDKSTLDVLVEEGVRFVILRRDQVLTNTNTSVCKVKTVSGDILVYLSDLDLSGALAFGDISNADTFADKLVSNLNRRRSLFMAVDFETFGHHRGWGSVEFLRYLVSNSLPSRGVRGNFDNTAGYASVVDYSSWSCPHSLGRWTGKCGCDGANASTMELKRKLYEGLRTGLEETNRRLDAKFGSGIWQRDFIFWFLSQRQKISNGKSVVLEGKYKEDFKKKLIALVGLTSCGWFFGNSDSIERKIPIETLSFLNG